MLKLSVAEEILSKAIENAEASGSRPLAVVISDAGGVPITLKRQDGAANGRVDLSIAKARSALALNIPTSQLAKFSERSPDVFRQLVDTFEFPFVSIPGGVLIKTQEGQVIGAAGVSGGDLSEEEAFVVKAINDAGLLSAPEPK